MDLDYQKYLPKDFDDGSRVWVYQANRLLTIDECLKAEPIINNFIQHWNTHSSPVKGFGTLLFGQFLLLMADEKTQYVSGCSTDSSVHMVKSLEELLGVSFFDRQLLAFYVKDKIERIPLAQLDYALKNDFINPDTLYFNNTVATKDELLHQWIIPLKNSWLRTRLSSLEMENK